jgi:F-type H+-transporting ATPase subunit b
VELLQEAEVWVAIGLLILVAALVWAKVPGMALKALDARGVKIQAELNEAMRLREEAEALLASIKVQREHSEQVAAEMIANAVADAERMRLEAADRLEETIKRRQLMAERKIATAEAQAEADVKAAAADLAARMAESLLAARLATLSSDPLIDSAVAQMAGKLQ